MALRAVVFDYGMVLTGLPDPAAHAAMVRITGLSVERFESFYWADRLGYDYAWQVEHHFLEEYSHSPTPEMFLAAASQRTKQIRLAHGIMQLTTSPPAMRTTGRLMPKNSRICRVASSKARASPEKVSGRTATVSSRPSFLLGLIGLRWCFYSP